MLQLARTKITLTPAEQDQLRAAVERDAPEFAHRLAHPLDVDRLEQPWFRRHRICDVQSAVPFPARRLHVAIGHDGLRVLTAHLDHLQAVAAGDPPLDLAAEDNAVAYAAYANAWTRTYPLGELKVGAFDDIPWFGSLDAADEATIADLRARFADRIGPEATQRSADGWEVHAWWIAHRQLVERVLVVPTDGQLRRTDTVHATEIPVPPGNQWRFVGGRLIPVG